MVFFPLIFMPIINDNDTIINARGEVTAAVAYLVRVEDKTREEVLVGLKTKLFRISQYQFHA